MPSRHNVSLGMCKMCMGCYSVFGGMQPHTHRSGQFGEVFLADYQMSPAAVKLLRVDKPEDSVVT